jgi:predicted Rossmann-fold nucleotide-binding protein
VRVIICGGRDYFDAHTIGVALATYASGKHTLVHGAQSGADTVAADIATARGWEIEPHRAEVERYGSPRAFHVRNQEMADAGADLCLAFPGGSGTANMVKRARKAGIEVHEIT